MQTQRLRFDLDELELQRFGNIVLSSTLRGFAIPVVLDGKARLTSLLQWEHHRSLQLLVHHLEQMFSFSRLVLVGSDLIQNKAARLPVAFVHFLGKFEHWEQDFFQSMLVHIWLGLLSSLHCVDEAENWLSPGECSTAVSRVFMMGTGQNHLRSSWSTIYQTLCIGTGNASSCSVGVGRGRRCSCSSWS